MDKIKSIIKNLLPYSYVRDYNKRASELDRVDINFNSDNLLSNEQPKFQQYVTTMGFGFSGHSAVLDLLKEYPQNLEFGDKHIRHYECDFARHSGGMFEIEKYLDSTNIFINDALLHRTIDLFRYFKVLKFNKRAKQITDSYVSSLIDIRIPGMTSVGFNPHLQDFEFPNKEILYLKRYSVEEFRSLCRQYMIALFNCFYQERKDNLILNHLFTDGEFDMKKLNDYLPNLKVIVIYRDPRDVYAQAVNNQVQWIPTNNIDDFIEWYRYSIKKYRLDSSDYLSVSFDSLICNYEQEVVRIEKYLALDSATHVDKFKYLDPQKSIKNVGLWKSRPELAQDMKRIEEEFPGFIFTEK